MVLELKISHETELAALRPLIPVSLSFVLSFIYLSICWQNHHHLFQAVEHIKGGALWANSHLLFWLALIPFATAWMGENHLSTWPVALCSVMLFCCAIPYPILVRVLVSHHGNDSALAIGRDGKGKISLVCYLLGTALAFWSVWLALAIYAAMAVLWLFPDRRIEAGRFQGSSLTAQRPFRFTGLSTLDTGLGAIQHWAGERYTKHHEYSC